MLIVNADDFGLERTASDNIMACIGSGRVTAAGAMMFMSDSERAADLAKGSEVEIGLHLNLTQQYTAAGFPGRLQAHLEQTVKFLKKNKYAFIVYHPLLNKSIDYLTGAQLDEFHRLYGRSPAFVNGHHHMHLASNIIFRTVFRPGICMRRNHSFIKGEKSWFNRMYRKVIDAKLLRKFTTTDYFFDIQPISDRRRLERILSLSVSKNVELMVHPSNQSEKEFLLNPEFADLVGQVTLANFSRLRN